MIQQVHLGVEVQSEGDFNLFRNLLDALGCKGRGLESDNSCQTESFLPPASVLEVSHRSNSRDRASLELILSDPDTAVEIIQRMGLEIFADHSGPEPSHFFRSFRVRLPGGTVIGVNGLRTDKTGKGFDRSATQGDLSAKGFKFAIVVSRFNSFIVERLLSGALDCLSRSGAGDKDAIEIVRVPGAFEIPAAARTLAETKKYDAIICLGCLLRGDTAHFDVIVNEVTRGIGQSAQETRVPHAFGVLTCDTLEQAIDRAGLKLGNKGFEAALAAVEMANLEKAIRTAHSGNRVENPRSGRGLPVQESPKNRSARPLPASGKTKASIRRKTRKTKALD